MRSSAPSTPSGPASGGTRSAGPRTPPTDACAPTGVAASGVRTTSRRGRRCDHRSERSDVLRIALIGCGHIGTVHSYALGQLTRAGLVDAGITATYDPDHDRAVQTAGHHDATAHDSLEAALTDVDVAWICTWTAGPADAVRAAVDRDLAVFCEKPLAPTIE